MRRLYNDMDICFRMEGVFVRVLNIVFEHGEGLHDGSLFTDLILSVNLKIDTILLHGIR